jgi:ribose/xylose/arabinose/galactoside ABC-type transport system permease subunit
MKKFLKSKMFTLLLLLALLVIVVTIATKGQFIALDNIKQILDQMFVTALLTIGAGMLLISGQIDLSTGAVGTMSALMFAFLMKNMSWPLLPAFLVALVVSAAFGVINSALINELRFQGFIATMAMASIAEGLAFVFTGGATVNLTNKIVAYIATGKFGGVVPISVVLLIVFFVVYGLILAKTKFGRCVYLVGGNPHAARLSGVNPKRISYILFVNSSILGALAGILFAARIGNATSNGIKTSQFSGITAAILGGIAFGGGAGGMGGAFVGLLILNTFSRGMLILHFDPYWQTVVSGLLLLAALTLDFLSNKSAMKSKTV